jgi:mono/diheme cytochrome c family protein
LGVAGGVARAGEEPQKTSRDKVYSKAQADRGSKTFAKVCAACHDPAKLDPKKEKGPELIGEKFIEQWSGKPLSEVMEITLLTMPNDGSAVLSEDETADVIAYILQANGHPEGEADLKYAAGKDIVIAK